MDWKVTGADRKTGEDATRIVAAETERDAIKIAGVSLFIESISPMQPVAVDYAPKPVSPSNGQVLVAQPISLRLELWMLVSAISLLGAIGVFLPWVSAPIIGSMNGARGDGMYVLGSFILAGAVAPLMLRRRSVAGAAIVVLCGLISSGVAAHFAYRMSTLPAESRSALSDAINIGIGVFVCALCGLGLIAAAAVILRRPK